MDDVELLREDIKKKWETLEKVRAIDYDSPSLAFIRRKIYEQQDKLIELIAKRDLEIKPFDLVRRTPLSVPKYFHTEEEPLE